MSFSIDQLVVGQFKYNLNQIYHDKTEKREDSASFLLRMIPEYSVSLTGDEIQTLLDLSHPNIQKIHSYQYDPSNYYFAVEHGITLLQHIRGRSSIGIDEAIKMMEGLVKGLQYLHDKEIIHTNIHPANILVVQNEVKLANYKFPEEDIPELGGNKSVRNKWSPVKKITLHPRLT